MARQLLRKTLPGIPRKLLEFLQNDQIVSTKSVRTVNARSSYRVVYPWTARPLLALDGSIATAPVVECSEGGLSFEAPATGSAFQLGVTLRGRLDFQLSYHAPDSRDGLIEGAKASVQVTGEIVRIDGQLIVARLDAPGIPFRVLMREQLALRAQYPRWPELGADDTRAAYPPLRLEP